MGRRSVALDYTCYNEVEIFQMISVNHGDSKADPGKSTKRAEIHGADQPRCGHT